MTNELPVFGAVTVPSKLLMKALAECASEIRSRVVPVRAGKGTHLGCRLGEILFVVFRSETIPARSTLVALCPRANRVWIPATRRQDVIELGAKLCMKTLPDLVALWEYVNMEFGAVEKRSFARRLESAQDFRACGLTEIDWKVHLGSQDQSLWWQEWGGKMFRVTFASDVTGTRFECEQVASRVGKYHRLPFYALR